MNAAEKRVPDRPPASRAAGLRRWESLLFGVALAIFIANSFASPYFLDAWNLSDATFNFTEKAMIAFPMALVIISGEIDLSVASIIAVVSTALGAAAQAGAGPLELVVVGLAVGLACGALQRGLRHRARSAFDRGHHRHDEPVPRDQLHRPRRRRVP